jgi:hypothetical protein
VGFMDKVKAAAQDVAKETKKAAAHAQDKVGEAQTKKKMNDLAEQLGWLMYRERTEGTPGGADADGIVAEISALKAQLDAEQPASPEGAPPEGGSPAG